ncbi:hypothetical protein MJO29_016603 [Puccinia striiformis f. sp. tritici]|nr:hypothetical protein MJO29_016603 [Puccinia striiformis f. sp. tritici]
MGDDWSPDFTQRGKLQVSELEVSDRELRISDPADPQQWGGPCRPVFSGPEVKQMTEFEKLTLVCSNHNKPPEFLSHGIALGPIIGIPMEDQIARGITLKRTLNAVGVVTRLKN